MRMVVRHPWQRTVLPLAEAGTVSTLRHRRLGHMMRRDSALDTGTHLRSQGSIGEIGGHREPPMDFRTNLSDEVLR